MAAGSAPAYPPNPPFPPQPPLDQSLRRFLTRAEANSSPATQSTAAASGGVAAALVVILVWLLSLFHIDVPSQVAVAFTAIAGALVHALVIKYGFPLSE